MSSTSNERPFAVVTGGSSGIGRELAAQFVERGYDVLIAANEPAVDAVAGELSGDGNVEALQVDLADHAGVARLVDVVLSRGRSVDAIAINAGVGVGGDFLSTSLEAELDLIDLNVRSTVALAKPIYAQMCERKHGKMLFTSSIAGTMATPYEAVYGASKAFVKSFAASLRYEARDRGVTVTTLMPGPTDTNFFHNAGMDDTSVGATKAGEGGKADPRDVAREAIDALLAGRDQVIAGSMRTKIEGTVAPLLPEGVTAARHGSMAAPGSA